MRKTRVILISLLLYGQFSTDLIVHIGLILDITTFIKCQKILLLTQTFRVYYPSSVWETVNNTRCSKLSKVKARARKIARAQLKCSWNWCWFHLVARFPNKKSASFQLACVGYCFRYISAYPASGHLRYCGPWSWNVVPQGNQECCCVSFTDVLQIDFWGFAQFHWCKDGNICGRIYGTRDFLTRRRNDHGW